VICPTGDAMVPVGSLDREADAAVTEVDGE
jgi:hypothetical protein